MLLKEKYNSYNKIQNLEDKDPMTLVLMLYQGALKFLGLAKEGMLEKDAQKKGINISKTIAIISELNACLNASSTNETDEAVDFAKALYVAMLTELPKASLNNDIKIINLSISYITKMKNVWEQILTKENKKKQSSSVAISDNKKKVSITISA